MGNQISIVLGSICSVAADDTSVSKGCVERAAGAEQYTILERLNNFRAGVFESDCTALWVR
jgi:hypothetical protein